MLEIGESSEDLVKEQVAQVEEQVTRVEDQVVKKISMGSVKLGGTKFDIVKYDGRGDYLLWERQVKGALKAAGLGKVLRAKLDGADKDDWNELQEQAVSIIVLYLQPMVLRQIEEYPTCALLFEALEQRFHRKESSNRLYTSLKLMSFKMKDLGTKIQDHIDGFNDLVIDLQNLGEELSDERKTLHLLSSLPSFYQSLSHILLHRDKKTITYNEVVNALLTDDLQQKLMMPSQSSSSVDTALNVTRGRSQWRSNDRTGKNGGSRGRSKFQGKSQDRKPVVCWKCGKTGHIKKNCQGSGKAIDPSGAHVAKHGEEDDLLVDDIAL